jgi:ppGpp synthetase/RelA/SpoT-type nucleotidyltranferase
MSDYQSISAGEHRRQISAYAAQRAEHYEPYAHVLGRVLEAACRTAIPQAVVQSRAKSITSFAEKCARRYTACPDAVNQFTDLCGARVIVQTRDQVAAVCAFIRTSFCVIEEDDKGLRLAEDSFGYRDMHFVIQLEPTRCHVLGITAKEQESIGSRRAEIQVRTWVQHAWADTLHDRMYKVKLKLPTEFRRIGALLAALMEDGDRTFSRLALDIDQMLANYSAYAVPDVVQREIVIMELLLENAQSQQKPSAALQLARLLIPGGECARAVEMLDPYAVVKGHCTARSCWNWGMRSAETTGRVHLPLVTSGDRRVSWKRSTDLEAICCVLFPMHAGTKGCMRARRLGSGGHTSACPVAHRRPWHATRRRSNLSRQTRITWPMLLDVRPIARVGGASFPT